jgi:aerobic-type carbon monoxide dehydrogenase small subunit (CoxS/CutS family)
MHVTLTVNDRAYEREVAEDHTLLALLRDDLGLTGTKEGCAAGECGACTVVFNGEVVNSCMVLAAESDGASLQTIEGEAVGGELSPIQQSLLRHQAVQCGFCTGGMVLSIRELLERNPRPSVDDIKDGIEGNFCRCTGYQQIIEAVLDVSGQLTDATKGELKHV